MWRTRSDPENICWSFIMPDYSLVPVDHQPDFTDISLAPVEHDPFDADDLAQQARSQIAAQPKRIETAAVQSDIGAPLQSSDGSNSADFARGGVHGAPPFAPSIVPSDGDDRKIKARLPEFADGSSIVRYARSAPSLYDDSKPDSSYSSQYQYSMTSHAAYSKCVDKCLHLLPSPSGDLQSSEFRLCVARCMGRL